MLRQRPLLWCMQEVVRPHLEVFEHRSHTPVMASAATHDDKENAKFFKAWTYCKVPCDRWRTTARLSMTYVK